jgi:hypothetical protein
MTRQTKVNIRIASAICFVILLLASPIKTTIVPRWKIQVVDESCAPCANMRVTQDWGHYRLYLNGRDSAADGFTDVNGYVEFPERTIRASLGRRIFMPVLTRIATLMHGGWVISASVWATGIKDVPWLSYHADKPLPAKMRVEKCTDDRPSGTPAFGTQ